MAITMGSSVTLDESDGLQNAAASTAAGDINDNDIFVDPVTRAQLPAVFAAALSSAGTFIDAALSGYNGTNSGLNAFSFSISGASGLGFTDSAGAALSDDISGLLTTAGDAIKLYTDVNDNNILYGMVGGAPGVGTIAFAAYLEETGTPLSGAKLWTIQYLPIKDPTADPDEALDLTNMVYVTIDQQVKFSFANAPSGQNLFLMIGNEDSGIVVTGRDAANQSEGESINTGDTVNTSQGGGATTIGANNQMVDIGEGMYLTYVTDPNLDYTIPNLTQGEADLEANIDFGGLMMTHGGGFDVSQLQKAKTATIQLTALETTATSGAGFIDAAATNTPVEIDSVVVSYQGQVIESFGTGTDVDSAGISIEIDLSGVATVTGVKAGYTIDYHTTDEHNRLLIENTGSGAAKAAFDIGGVSILDTAQTSDEIGSLMRFEDAGPSIVQGTPTDTADVNTQDADTKGVNTDTDTQSFAAAFTISSSNYDADGAGSTSWAYALSLPTAGADSLLKSAGATIYLHRDATTGVVSGSTSASGAGVTLGNTIFDLAVSATGVVTLRQYAQIDHALPGVGSNFAAQQAMLANGLVMLNATATITDADGDSASAMKSLDLGGNVKFDDDGPGTFTPDALAIVNTGSASGTDDLHSDGTEGADITGTVLFADNVPADDLLRDTNGTLLQSGGENITLSGWGTTTLTATRVTTGDTVFVATLNNTTDQYTLTFSRSIDDGGGVDFLGAAPVKSGNPTYNILNNVGGTTIDLLFSGGDTTGELPSEHSVNVSTTGAGTDNQSMNASGGVGDLLRMDFEIGASLAGSPLGSDFNAGTHTDINGFSFLVSQNTPSGTTATAFIQAYDADDDKQLTGDLDDTVDPITQVMVNGIIVFSAGVSTPTMINGYTVNAIMHDDGIILTGLNEGATGDGTGGDDPVIKIFTADGFNRVEVSNYAGQNVGGVLGGSDFDIAPAGFDIGVVGEPFAFQLPVRNFDYDGDYSPIALIGVNVSPEPLP